MKIKYRIVLLRKEFNGLNVVKSINVKIIKNSFKFAEKTFLINVEKPTFIQNNYRIYCLDYDNNSQFTFNSNEVLMNAEELDLIVSNNLIRQITAGAMDNFKDKIVNMIIGALIGAALVGLIAMAYLNSKLEEIYSVALDLESVTVGVKIWLKIL